MHFLHRHKDVIIAVFIGCHNEKSRRKRQR